MCARMRVCECARVMCACSVVNAKGIMCEEYGTPFRTYRSGGFCAPTLSAKHNGRTFHVKKIRRNRQKERERERERERESSKSCFHAWNVPAGREISTWTCMDNPFFEFKHDNLPS